MGGVFGAKMRQGGEVGKDTARAGEVSGCIIEDGVFFGEARRPVALVRELILWVLGRIEDGTWEDG